MIALATAPVSGALHFSEECHLWLESAMRVHWGKSLPVPEDGWMHFVRDGTVVCLFRIL